MELKLWMSDKIRPGLTALRMKKFFQMMLNRILQGTFRYDPPSKDQNYLDCLEKELNVYKRTGNKEHLLNIGNYAMLEFYYPQISTKFDVNARSVRR